MATSSSLLCSERASLPLQFPFGLQLTDGFLGGGSVGPMLNAYRIVAAEPANEVLGVLQSRDLSVSPGVISYITPS